MEINATDEFQLDRYVHPCSKIYSWDNELVQEYEWYMIEKYDLYKTNSINDMNFLEPSILNTNNHNNNGPSTNDGQELSKENLKKRIRYDKRLRELAAQNIQTLTTLTSSECQELG